jgi:hypothetical protein
MRLYDAVVNEAQWQLHVTLLGAFAACGRRVTSLCPSVCTQLIRWEPLDGCAINFYWRILRVTIESFQFSFRSYMFSDDFASSPTRASAPVVCPPKFLHNSYSFQDNYTEILYPTVSHGFQNTIAVKTWSSGRTNLLLSLIGHATHRKRRHQQFFVGAGTYLLSHCLATIGKVKGKFVPVLN